MAQQMTIADPFTADLVRGIIENAIARLARERTLAEAFDRQVQSGDLRGKQHSGVDVEAYARRKANRIPEIDREIAALTALI